MERQPRNAEHNNGAGNERPSGNGQRTRSSASSRRPSSGNKRPANRSGRPSSGNRRPSSGSTRPANRSGRPSSGNRRPSSGQARPSGQRPSSGKRRPSSAQAARKRREAQMRKKRFRFFAACAALAVIIAVVVIILVSSLTVPEAQDLTIESSSSAQVLSWKGKPKSVTYLVYRKTGNEEYELVNTVAEGADSTFVSRDLKSATRYEYKVVAVKEIGGKPKESKGRTAEAYTLPETIKDVKARTMSKDSLTLTFADAQPVDSFEVRYGSAPNLSEPELLTVPYKDAQRDEKNQTCSVTIPNQKEGTVLYFSIRSICGENAENAKDGKEGEKIASEWSDVSSGTVTRAIDMTGIDTSKPMVALTFDDGPDKGEFTTRILEAIEAAGGHGTFFQLGQLVESFPEISKRIVSGGHQMGCHTYDHDHMGAAVTSEDITRANDAIQEVTGVRPSAFRCPGGELTDTIRSVCESEGQSIFYWGTDTRDWSSRDADSVVSEIQNQVEDGDIVLMHNIYGSTADAVERIVPWLIKKGYQLVTVDQLIQAKTGEPPAPGVQYFSGTSSDAKKKADQ